MDDKLERIFINFANNHEDVLEQMNLSKDEFVENAKEWSQTDDGKLEIQKFILQQEIDDLKKQIEDLESVISKKEESIEEINNEINNL